MAAKSERIFTEMHGIPATYSGIAFTDTSANVELDSNSTYRLCANQDCYYNIATTATAADADSVFLPTHTVEYVSTTLSGIVLSVIRETDDGILSFAKMDSRGR